MDNRAEILNAALDLFHARGYDAVGVQEIVERAGVTKPTLYYYFGSKLGLLKSLLETGYQILEAGVLEASRTKAGLPEVLYQVARVFLTLRLHMRNFTCLCCRCFIRVERTRPFRLFLLLLKAIIKLLSAFLKMHLPSWEICGEGSGCLRWALQEF